MTKNEIIANYAQTVVNKLASGQAKEHAYRPALELLMASFEDVDPVNDPKRSEHGNPDMVFLKKSNRQVILGYAEAKDVDISLDKTEKTNQMQRYSGYDNLFLTNYLEFRFYLNGDKQSTIEIGRYTDGFIELFPENYGVLADELENFITARPESIRSGKRLALIMGAKARRIRDRVNRKFSDEQISSDELTKIYNVMKELLVHDLSTSKFADMYAQTLVYGLFVARYSDTSQDTFSREEARELVPATNPFLKDFFDHIAGARFDRDLAQIVDELCEVFQVSDVNLLVHKHLRLFQAEGGDNEKDPIIHFYEDFLKEYDPEERKRMGAYYTPIPVVKFIIKHVDSILKQEFGLMKGIADTSKKQVNVTSQGTKHKVDLHKVQILDPAVGTATFLNETIKFIRNDFSGQEGRWSGYVHEDLLPRLHGFELMMTPYTIAHLKLGMTLQESGATVTDKRLGVYLTNTLEEGVKRQSDLLSALGLADTISSEAEAASKIKHERPIMVIIGNPPYSGESSNKTEYANSLVAKYKVEPGGKQKLQEDNSKWLNDDYVKFIAFAEDMIAKNGEGIVAMITNNGYLDNPTFRGMRWKLTSTFDKIYVYDLHGNSKKKEVSPDGGKDENVFDIQAGVSIILAIKTSKTPTRQAEVYHSEIYGTRKHKFKVLGEDVSWSRINLDEKFLLFTNNDDTGREEYNEGVSLDALFNLSSTGILTKNDKVAIAFDENTIWDNVSAFNELPPEILKQKFGLKKDSRDWALERAIADVKTSFTRDNIISLTYRPFDLRKSYYTGKSKGFMAYSQMKVMGHLFKKDNLAVISGRQGQAVGSMQWNLAFIVDSITDLNVFYRGGGTVFPLYVYDSNGERSANFNTKELGKLMENISGKYSPEDILDYIYAILYAPKYRETYKQFLKIDFPSVPKPKNNDNFVLLKDYGKKLRSLHLMKAPNLGNYSTTFTEQGTDSVEFIKRDEDQVWINDTQFFGEIPEAAWNFHIGGYQPAQKWLKDRKGRKLTNDDIEHYQKVVTVLIETSSIMKEIDTVIDL